MVSSIPGPVRPAPKRRNLFIAVLCLAFAGTAVAQTNIPAPAAVKIATLGSSPGLTGSNGMTLYIEDTDTNGKSVCNGPCALNWPPLTAAADVKPVGDSRFYFWKSDKQPGDVAGDGVAGRWHIAKP